MARDPYDVLGVKRDASDAEIQKAFRRLAKKSHPDLHPGDKKAEERFKDLNAAYDILGDATKRARFDRGEIDANGAEIRPNPFAGARGRAGGFAGGGGGGSESFAFEDLGDLFGGIFRGGRGGGPFGGGAGPFGGAGVPSQGEDLRFTLEVDFVDAITGAKKRLTLPGGKSLDVTIPAGINDGQTIRLEGQGGPGHGGPPGDALIEVKIRPHALFRREGRDIHAELGISLSEAVLGGKAEVPTVHGPVTLTIPKWASSGTRLRLKGKGVAATKAETAGDQYVTLKIMLPKKPDPELEEFIKSWAHKDYDPAEVIEPAKTRNRAMKYLHTMVRVTDLDQSLDFYCRKLGLRETGRTENEKGRFTLVFLAAPGDELAQVELTHNWDPEVYTGGRNFGHLAYGVDNIYETCQRLKDSGVVINRPPRDGRMAFVRSPDNISVELLQNGAALPVQEPWASMPNVGVW